MSQLAKRLERMDERLERLELGLKNVLDRVDSHEQGEFERYDRITEHLAENSRILQQVADTSERTEKSTAGVVELYNNGVGTFKTLRAFGNFVKWVISIPILGAGIYHVIEYFKG